MLNAREMIREMSIDIGIMPSHLRHIIETAPLRYKVFEIPKKNGEMRQVAQPAREVKKIQRWLIKELCPLLPIHAAATAYQQGSSIIKNAEAHVGQDYLLKIDFSDFFPSILRVDINRHLTTYCSEHFDAEAISLIAKCLCWVPARRPPLRLCIGAPSSPLISNSILFDFDNKISEIAQQKGIKYTRYADDLSFSCSEKGQLDTILSNVKEILKNLDYPNLTINTEKTVFASRKCRKVVTGVTLTADMKLSVGRERKKIIRAMYHRLVLGNLSPKEQEQLSGLLNFVESIEPGFLTRLRNSYKTKI